MNELKGLYFPGTGAKKELFCSLLCLLDKVDFYRIVEEKAAVGGDTDGSPYWQGQVVLPLGEDRERFLAMIRDIKIHAADYYGGYLSSLSTDSLVDREEASVWQLVASLHGKNPASSPDPVLTEKLWQARLVLKLAEILAEEQAELATGLAEFGRKEQAVFAALKGELDDSEDYGAVFQASNLHLDAGQECLEAKQLMKAWGALFVIDPTNHQLLVTDSEGAATIFFDAWEVLTGEPPRLLVELALPFVEELASLSAARDELAEVGGPIRQALAAVLAGEGVSGTVGLKGAAELWQQKVAAQGGLPWRVAIYLLPGRSLREVWGGISRMPVAKDSGCREQGLIAVLRPVPGNHL